MVDGTMVVDGIMEGGGTMEVLIITSQEDVHLTMDVRRGAQNRLQEEAAVTPPLEVVTVARHLEDQTMARHL